MERRPKALCRIAQRLVVHSDILLLRRPLNGIRPESLHVGFPQRQTTLEARGWTRPISTDQHALTEIGEAAQMESDFLSHVEAEFALWNMEVREREMAQATAVARRLAHDFPDNRELAAFLDAREASLRR